MDGYTTRTIHTFDPDQDSDDDELPSVVKYSIILQEEDDFLDED